MMVNSTFISVGIHFFFIMFVYFGLPSFQVKKTIQLPIDIVEDTQISSKTSLKLGNAKVKEVKKAKKVNIKEKVKKTPPPPPLPSKKKNEKKNIELNKKKKNKEITELIKKKTKIKEKRKRNKKNLKLILNG